MSINQLPSLQPSAEARKLYGEMVAKVNCKTGGFYLSLDKTISLSIDRKNKGTDSECAGLLYELVKEKWVAVHDEGGWLLNCKASCCD